MTISRAMILAAGRGERMRPLTDDTPKPLLKVGERTLIGAHLYGLAEIGIKDVLINTSYRSQQLKDFLQHGERFGVNITYSDEGSTPLGTAGGIINALPFFNHEPFLLISADISTNYPLENLLDKTESAVHCVLVDNPDYHPEGDFSLGDDGKLHTPGEKTLTYANISVWQSDFFLSAPKNTYSLGSLIHQAIQSESATGEYFKDIWYNVGTPKELQLANQALS